MMNLQYPGISKILKWDGMVITGYCEQQNWYSLIQVGDYLKARSQGHKMSSFKVVVYFRQGW